jgi:hypothetical protein
MFSIVLLGSCVSLHSGFVAPNSVSITSPNFKVISTIYGESNAIYFLGLGGTGKDGLIKEAKKNMYESYNLNNSEMITNITVDNKTSLYFGGIFAQHSVFISADVVKFGESESSFNNQTVEKPVKQEVMNNNEDVTIKLENLNDIKTGFLDYSETVKLKKGNKVLFHISDKYYKAVVNYRDYGKTNVKDIEVYNNETKIWNSSKKDNATIPNNTIIGYKL